MGQTPKFRHNGGYKQCEICSRRIPSDHINRHRAHCVSSTEFFNGSMIVDVKHQFSPALACGTRRIPLSNKNDHLNIRNKYLQRIECKDNSVSLMTNQTNYENILCNVGESGDNILESNMMENLNEKYFC